MNYGKLQLACLEWPVIRMSFKHHLANWRSNLAFLLRALVTLTTPLASYPIEKEYHVQ